MTDFCCSEIFDAFYDGVIEFDEDFPGSIKDLCIIGKYKSGDGTEGSDGRDRFKIYYCPFCGQKLQDL